MAHFADLGLCFAMVLNGALAEYRHLMQRHLCRLMLLPHFLGRFHNTRNALEWHQRMGQNPGARPRSNRKGTQAMRYLWLALVMPLAACSYTMPLTGADENGGTVNLVATPYGEDNAMDIAKDHCSKYHRVARMAHNEPSSNTMTFTCEQPGRPQEPQDPTRVTDRPYR
jgi:hypothetical protein